MKLTSPKNTHLGLQKKGTGNGFVLDDDEPVSEFEDRKAFLDYHFVKWLLVELAKDETTGKAKRARAAPGTASHARTQTLARAHARTRARRQAHKHASTRAREHASTRAREHAA